MASETAPVKFNEVLCIGLGLSGVCLAVQLKRRLGFEDIHLYDRNASHSGTWWANRYPGAACDLPAIFYSFSFELNPNWTRLLPSDGEIRNYLEGIVDKYQIGPRMTFRTECESAQWDSKRRLWVVHLRDLTTGVCYVHECRLLFSAVGMLVEPNHPDIPGMETFKGAMFHTARWRSDVDLANKNAVILGNGCSATQAVPYIAPQTNTLTQFIRTPHWLLERDNIKFGPGIRWAFRNIPLLERGVRFLVFLATENDWKMFFMNKSGTTARRAREKASREYVFRTAPEKYHDILIPDWEMGCKRRVFDDGYLKTLHAPNMHLTKDPILEVTPGGVRTATKSYPADVIILATGFKTNNGLGTLRIQGRNGEWLEDHWRNMGGPGGYNCTAVSGYPNFFMIFGPNAVTGHSSVILAIENMVNFAIKVAGPVISGEASVVELMEEAEKEYSRSLQMASSDKLWHTCSNWYVTNGWNSSVYPWSQLHFWWRSTFPTWRDWNYEYTTSPASRSFLSKAVAFIMISLGIIAGLLATLSDSSVSDGYLKFVPDIARNRSRPVGF